MIGKDESGEGRSEDEMSPFLQGVDHGKKFSIVDLVILFGRGKCSREECDGVAITVFVELGENGSEGVFRCVGFDLVLSSWVGEMEDGIGCEEVFERFEGCIALWGPFENFVFLC